MLFPFYCTKHCHIKEKSSFVIHTGLRGIYASMQLCTDLFKPGFNDGIPVLDGCDGVRMADAENSLPHAGRFI